MNIHTTEPFKPPRPAQPTNALGWYGLLKAVRTNALQIWPKEAYEQNVLSRFFIGRRWFIINDAAAIQHVLIDNAANYRRTPATVRILRPIVGQGLFLSEGEEWRHQRRTIAPALAPRVLPMLARHIVKAAEEAAARLEALSGGPVDLLSAMQSLALEIAARSMFSLEMTQYGAPLRRMITRFAPSLGRPYLLDMVLPPSVPTPHDLARKLFRRRWVALMDEIVSAREAAPPSDKPRDLFDMLRAARDPETGAAFSREQLRDQVSTMIVAGHETTALTLFWTLYLLASAPTEQERVAAEVSGLDFDPDRAGEMMAKLPYTRAVVNESLRLYPPAYVIARKAIGVDRVGDLTIPAGALVMVAPWILHRHVRLWDNPDAFIPSRFLGDRAPAHRFAYLPFGAGPRVCVGAQFALTEAALVVAMVLKRFEVTVADRKPVLPVAIITTAPDRSPLFRMRLRAERK